MAIVDDHLMVAEVLAHIVSRETDLELVGIAASVAEALVLVEHHTPQVVLMDYLLPDDDGAAATVKILKRWPETKVVMFSGSSGNNVVARAIEAGCSGFLAKDRPASDVVAAVRAASRGELVLRSDELASLLSQFKSAPNQQTQRLSARELEVLRLLARARSTDGIATELFLSIYTVRNHVSNILSKLGAHSKLEAVAIAARDGIIPLEEIG
ncbi:MAG TPA: response regulator transcription factor [Acidimicrobiales bacterium]|nr:response regulator transcription factor [Acidimicrobiales bacterium]